MRLTCLLCYLINVQVNTTSTAGKLAVATTVLSLAAVNLITIFVFLYKPFTWVDGTMARFMY